MTLATGTRLGPYEILAPLGAGGMGEVYRARDTRLGREVAIKSLSAVFAHDAGHRARFEREAQTLATLNHPNIAAIYGLEESGDARFLVLELVPGETLAERLAYGPLALVEALAVAGQIAAAIEAAHERGVVHRDLKPGNVMLTPQGIAKVLDFGLAKTEVVEADGGDPSESPTAVVRGATMAGTILGTAAYMSPEQARGRVVDRRSDVWSFGCVLYECLAGRRAFAGDTTSDLVAAILGREPDWDALPAVTPSRVREVLRRCLRKDPESRPRDIRDVRIELAGVTGGGGKSGGAREQSIAVLPFENLSGPDDEYFADGITDEILNALAQVDGLRVAARTSCFALKGRREELRAVGEKLDVGVVVEGSVRRAGNRLRIIAQLVSIADGRQLWSERYDRELTDVFAVQDEIAGAIAKRLSVSLRDGGARRGTVSLEAYELVLKGRALQLRRGRYLADAQECFERALALDPDYAEAMAWLADSWRLQGTFGVGVAAEVMLRARTLAERALAIDPRLAEAWATVADVDGQYDWDFGRAETAWQRALTIDPRHTRARCERVLWGLMLERIPIEQTLSETAAAVADDPLNSWAMGMLSFALGYAGRHDESIAEAERSHAADPDSVFPHWNLVRAIAWSGDLARARATALRLLGAAGRHHWMLSGLSWVFARLGETANARAVHDEMEARAHYECLSPAMLAMAASAAGRMEVAIAHLTRAVAEHDPIVLHARRMPYFDLLRADPRFDAITRGVWR